MIPLLFSMIIPTLVPLELDDPSTKTVHSYALSLIGKVILARKSANSCAFSAFLDS
jgi:hypothetical protein